MRGRDERLLLPDRGFRLGDDGRGLLDGSLAMIPERLGSSSFPSGGRPREFSFRERLSRRIFGHWSQRVVDNRLAESDAVSAECERLAAAGDWQGIQRTLDRYRARRT